jgi:hypothetical protein
VQPLWKTIWRLLNKVNIDLSYDPAIPRLAIYPKNVTQVTPEAPAHHVYCSTIHNSQVMETAEMLHNGRMVKKIWYLCTMEFYSAMKKNEILSFTSKWMELKNIILSKSSQAQKTKSHVFFLLCRL